MNMNMNLNKHSGITLIELLVGIALIAILAPALSTLTATLTKQSVTGSVDANLQQDARWAVDMIARELAACDASTAQPTVSPDGSALTFVKTLANGTTESITYSLGPAPYEGTLYRTVANQAHPVTEQTTRGSIAQTSDLNFQIPPATPQSVTITLTLSKSIPNSSTLHSEKIRTQVTIPNKNKTIQL